MKKIIDAKPPEVSNLRGLLDYATQIAEGLQAAHEKRNGSPHHQTRQHPNYRITTGENHRFWAGEISGPNLLTEKDTSLGTVADISPEQAQELMFDHRIDIWAVSVVVCEMVTGSSRSKAITSKR